MTGPPNQSLLSERFAPRIQIKRGVCLLENSRRQLSITANGMKPGSASGHALAQRCATQLPAWGCVAGKPPPWIHRDELRQPKRRKHSALHRTASCSVPAQKLGGAISLLGDGTIVACPDTRLP
jgi:hypothetical protein